MWVGLGLYSNYSKISKNNLSISFYVLLTFFCRRNFTLLLYRLLRLLYRIFVFDFFTVFSFSSCYCLFVFIFFIIFSFSWPTLVVLAAFSSLHHSDNTCCYISPSISVEPPKFVGSDLWPAGVRINGF